MKKRNNALTAKPFVLDGIEYPNLCEIDNSTREVIDTTILKKTGPAEMKVLAHIVMPVDEAPLGDPREVAILTSFRQRKCKVCGDKTCAIGFTKTELGDICKYCWKEMEHGIFITESRKQPTNRR